MRKFRKSIGVGNVKIGHLAKKYIRQILDTNRLSYGPFTERFEKRFAVMHGVKFALFCNAGTSALQASLHALKGRCSWQDGDEILVPAVTFPTSVNVVLKNNLMPVFVDVDRDYFEIDVEKIEAKISKKTRAIMPVHLCGLPCDMEAIKKIAKKHQLKIIEDSCETVLAKYKGKPVGTWSDVSCFSTYAAHVLITGVGGFACTNDGQLARDIKSLFNHGRDSIYLAIDDDAIDIKKEKFFFEVIKKRFNFVNIGYNYRITEMEAALGLAQLETIHREIKKRNENAQYLSEGLRDLEEFLQPPKIRPRATHSFQMYPMVCGEGVNRENLIFYLEKGGIETRYLLPLLNQPIYTKLFGRLEDKYPVAKMLNQKGFYIGCHPGLKKKELKYIISRFHKYFKKPS